VDLPDVELRPLRRADLPLLARWLAEPLVARWWAHETTPEAVERDFGPSLDGADATALYLGWAAYDGTTARPFGLVQVYPIAAYPEYVEELTPVCPVPLGALSIDYLVGEPAARGRGLGAGLIAAAVARGFADHPGASDVLVPVALGNVASWRALERAGGHRFAEGELTPDNPADPRDHVVHRFTRG
jgi:aminoglycoside 6'-N-acetyltransferase